MSGDRQLMKFKELTDEQWEFIKPLLPSPAREGRPRVNDRRTVNAILYVLTTGCRWMDLPREYGDDSTANLRLRRWEEQGVWKRILKGVIATGYSRGRLSIDRVSVESSDVAAKKGGEGDLIGYDGHKKVKGSKIHAAVTHGALPLSVIVGEANEHDSRKLMPVVKGISVETGARPRNRPKELYADKAYDTFIVRWYLRKRRIKPQIPRRSRRRNPGRPPVFDECSYKKYRSSVERFFSMLKGGFRRLAIRYERLASTFMGLINIACFIIHWRVLR